MHVVVAGAGIAGLTAGLAAARRGADVTILDSSEHAGGMLRTSTFAGRHVDEGADAFLVRRSEALELAHDVGLGDELVHPARRDAAIWHDGALRPLPPNLLGVPLDLDATEASGLLSAAGMDHLRSDVASTTQRRLPDHDVSLADALAPLGSEVVAHITEPLVGAINAGVAERQSLAAVVPDLDTALRAPGHRSVVAACRAAVQRTRSRSSPDVPVFAAPADGIAALPDAVLAAALATGRVEVRLGVTATRVLPGPALEIDDGTTMDADGVVVATPGRTAADLVADVAPDAAATLARIDHTSVVIVRLALEPDSVGVPLDASGVLLPRDGERLTTACSFASSKWARLAPERGDGTLVLRCALGRDGGPVVTDLDDATLVERALDDLTPVLGLRGAPTEASVHRWESAFPQYRPGHLDRIATVGADLAANAPGVALAGMYLRGVGIPAVVASAQAAATRVTDTP